MQEADEMMESRKSGDFLSHGMWLKSVVTEDVIYVVYLHWNIWDCSLDI